MNRTLDRQGMKEFENRILFQMSANDSSTLIDTPAASKLGENRALYYSEEENRIEKFRPYGIPEVSWLESVKQKFAARPKPEVHVQAGCEWQWRGRKDRDARAWPCRLPNQPRRMVMPAPTAMATPPLAESHSPGGPAVDDVVEPPVEAF